MITYSNSISIFDKAAILNLARSYIYQGKINEAVSLCMWALEHHPCDAALRETLGAAKYYSGDVEGAIADFRLIVCHDPSYVKANSSLLLAMIYAPDVSAAEIYEEAKYWDERHGTLKQYTMSPLRRRPIKRPLKIGFVSGDLREHSVSYFLEPLLDSLRTIKVKVETACYSDVTTPDHVTERLKNLVSHWIDISGLSDEEVAAKIHYDSIDVLIDLAGHSGRRIRLPVFSGHPARLQISWLGYPATTGLTAIDCRITDEIADPLGEADRWHSERLIRLKGGFLCYQAPANAPDVSLLPAANNGYITFGSFNMLPKLSLGTIITWAKILRRVPDSRILLKCPSFADMQAANKIARAFRDFGIESSRVMLRSASPTTVEHLACYAEMDIALDPFPYCGTTTTFEALWMGVPVITLLGDRHAGRVGASILTHIEHKELIAQDASEYVNTAVSIANDSEKLICYRGTLRKRLSCSTLCDPMLFTHEFMSAIKKELKYQAYA